MHQRQILLGAIVLFVGTTVAISFYVGVHYRAFRQVAAQESTTGGEPNLGSADDPNFFYHHIFRRIGNYKHTIL